ncbi:YsnF/AvaK domain-containing protein [Pseudopontixanthobacter vadosimaris]|uniref:YsnF/AvaK domain-containing protein n=1 Tax=Pseudopontixanthobacter vadosimaris TaxID=2726450 RepID=UPI0014767BF8|nr:YsnF/AvaK domain-containing protein [Pseudopontixanthobacter vadosimaris]
MADRKDPRDAPGGRLVEEVAIPIVEEHVSVDKRIIEGQTVTVTTRPVSSTETISQQVTKETVTVERVPVNSVVDAIPEVRRDGDLTVIPVVEERIVVTKQLVLTEEIHLRRTSKTVTDEKTVELRRTEVDIEK